ncbi:DDE-type integrase/transposase/recombinase [Micromonospora sp. NPDC094482]|uniref:DDE-type integrase/transposase/recombinase n=1 Tax=unclassified Micromonospora TaxID=2617518 RepID=UPI00332DC9E7
MRGHDRDRHRRGKLYLATVVDLYSQRMLGYAMVKHHDAGLLVAALNVAAITCGGDVVGAIFHSDRGSEYCSADLRTVAGALVDGSGRLVLRNAVAAATYSTLKVEYVRSASSAPAPGPGPRLPAGSPTSTNTDADTPSAAGSHPSNRAINGAAAKGPSRITGSAANRGIETSAAEDVHVGPN